MQDLKKCNYAKIIIDLHGDADLLLHEFGTGADKSSSSENGELSFSATINLGSQASASQRFKIQQSIPVPGCTIIYCATANDIQHHGANHGRLES